MQKLLSCRHGHRAESGGDCCWSLSQCSLNALHIQAAGTATLKAIEQLQKAFSLDPSNCDILSDIAEGWLKAKQYSNTVEILKQKMAACKTVTVTDHYNLSSAYYYNKQFSDSYPRG